MKCNKNFLFISFIYALLNIVDSEIFDNQITLNEKTLSMEDMISID